MPQLIVVDDEPSVGTLVRRTAEAAGYEVRTATSAKGFETLRAEKDPDVIVLDVVMPDTDGIELLGRLAAEGSTSRVILLSGYPDYLPVAARIARGSGLTVVGQLLKPFRVAALQELLAEAANDPTQTP